MAAGPGVSTSTTAARGMETSSAAKRPLAAAEASAGEMRGGCTASKMRLIRRSK